MKWIVVAILLMIVPYTIVTLLYRKPGKPFEPYADMKTRANTLRLLNAGYRRVELTAELPADPLQHPVSAPIAPAAGGLPAELNASVIERPALPAEITRVSAPPSAHATEPYAFRFACAVADEHRQIAAAELYLKGNEIVVTPRYAPLGGELLARSRDNIIQLTVPAGVLTPGHYRATIVGEKASRAWSFEVR